MSVLAPAVCLFAQMRTNRNATEVTAPPVRLLSRKQVGELMGVHPGSIARYERAGLLKSVKFNARLVRYPETEVREFIANAAVA